MPRPGLYNDNEYRAYPFVFPGVYDGVPCPTSTVVDAGFIMGLFSAFDPTADSVWLTEITRSGTTLTFTFNSTATGTPTPLQFTRDTTDEPWVTEHLEGTNWEGFIVTGPLDDLLVLLPTDGVLEFSMADCTVEPGRIQSLVKSYLRSITVANYSRLTATPPEDCQDSSAAVVERSIVVNAEALQGDIVVKEGYNCQIDQTDFANELQIGAQKGAGTPADSELCESGSQLPLTPGESLPEGSKFYSGGPACDELLFTINGVGGPNVNIVPGAGIELRAEPETNTITINFASNNLVGNCATE